MNYQKKQYRALVAVLLLPAAFIAPSCQEEDPPKENVPELITQVTLAFAPAGGGAAVTVTATDPDGEGVQDIVASGPVNLSAGTTYTLTLELVNGLSSPSSPDYDISAQIEAEADEHLFFFGWTVGGFSDPVGDGNIDSRADDINYNDTDANGLPLGLSTTWTTAGALSAGEFRVLLKHQPELKSASSGSTTGETDLDLTFTLNVN